MKKILLPLIALSLVAGAQAQVVFDSSATFTTSANSNDLGGAATYTFDNTSDLVGFDPTGSDKLVVLFGSENMNGISSITYGGVALTQALYNDNSKEMGVYFLDNPVTNGDLFIDGTANGNGIGGAIFALSNTKTGFAVTSVTDGSSTSLSAASGSLIAAVGVKNQTSDNPLAASPLTSVFSSGSGSSATGVGYQITSVAGTVTPTFDNTPIRVGAVEFQAVPEPSSFALLAGCFGLTWVMLRRRS